MGRFNTKKITKKTTNLAGGEAYTESAKLEFASILLTSFVKNEAYRSASKTIEKVRDLFDKVPPLFAAKAAIYARNDFGMRSISHIIAADIAKKVKKEEWTKKFFNRVFVRPDDILETFGFYESNNGARPLPNSLKKGTKMALERFDAYKLAKYRGEGKAYSMVDIVNLVHPKHTIAFKKLMKGTLKNTETWEAKISEEGQKGSTEEEVLSLKEDAWTELLKENKLAYFALLRNLRNIHSQAPKALKLALKQLVNRKAIKTSKVLPFRFMTAVNEIESIPDSMPILNAISDALDISVDNVPKFKGKTLIAIDVSSSMSGDYIKHASILGAALYKAGNADMMLFAEKAKLINFIGKSPTLLIAKVIKDIQQTSQMGGRTDFNCVFPALSNAQFDRIIFLSDMQGWIGYKAPVYAFNEYKKKANCDPSIISIDLAGLGTLQFPEKKILCIAGFSEKIFDVMKLLEKDKDALIKKIEAITI